MSDDAPKNLPALVAGTAVQAIVPQDFDGAWRLALAVTKAGMAPRGLETPEKAMVAILHGLEVGFTPMAALQSIAVIQGRPTIWGDGAIGLVRGSGKCEYIKEWIEGEGDAMTAYCEAKRKGEPNPVTRSFSVADAKLAKLWGKTGSNGAPTPWVTNPKRMLAMRARGFTLRDLFADVLRGLGIAEEVQDYQPIEEKKQPPAPPEEEVKQIEAVVEEKPVAKPRKKKEPPKPVEEEKVEETVIDKPVVHDEQTGEVIEDAEVSEIVEEEEKVKEDGATAEVTEGTSELTPDQKVSAMEKDMLKATTVEEVQEAWNTHDIPASVEGHERGSMAIMVARAIRKRELARVS